MASKEPDFEIVRNKTAKSHVWAQFGFVKKNDEVDRKSVACRLCLSVLKYSGNTTNLSDHLKRKHPTFGLPDSKSKSQQQITQSPHSIGKETGVTSSQSASYFSIFGGSKISPSSQRGKAITAAMAQFIVKDLRPYSVVQNSGFKNLIQVLEPKYTIPSRQHFSEKVIPEIYTKVSAELKKELKGNYVAITTDGWTSRATESYVTITSSHINHEWNIKNYVLQVKFSFRRKMLTF